ncbi:hypothetical protein QCA50_006565 [Cerrena zonata]|uniref:Uncharacterized protein n=1 Tax=Cerrena zonata TaxID=2478898 RepID=A0AAW0GK58_9APHY
MFAVTDGLAIGLEITLPSTPTTVILAVVTILFLILIVVSCYSRPRQSATEPTSNVDGPSLVRPHRSRKSPTTFFANAGQVSPAYSFGCEIARPNPEVATFPHRNFATSAPSPRTKRLQPTASTFPLANSYVVEIAHDNRSASPPFHAKSKAASGADKGQAYIN